MFFRFISTFFEIVIDNTCQVLAQKTQVNQTISVRILPIVFLSSWYLLFYLISFLCPYNYIMYVEKAEN